MPAVIRKIIRWALQLAAGLVILLALLVGVARLLLPEVASFSKDIRAGVLEATGFELDFELLSAGMSRFGPELRMTVVGVRWPDGSELFKAEQIAISLDVRELITAQRLAPKRLLVRGSDLRLRIDKAGQIYIQGHVPDDFSSGEEPLDIDALPDLRLHFEDIRVNFTDQRNNQQELNGVVKELIAELKDQRIDVAGDFEPGQVLGEQLELRGEIPLAILPLDPDGTNEQPWRLWVGAQDFRLDAWLELLQAQDLPIINSRGSATADLEFAGLKLVRLQSSLALSDIELPQPDAQPAPFDAISGKIEWQQSDSGWEAAAQSLELTRAGNSWPASDMQVSFAALPDGQSISGSADFIRTDDLNPLLRAFASKQLEENGLRGEFRGDVSDLEFSFSRRAETFEDYRLVADFEQLGYLSQADGIEMRGFSGTVSADEAGGKIELATRDANFGFRDLFRENIPVSALDGIAIWNASADGYRMLARDIEVVTQDGQGSASIELTLNSEFREPWIDLQATASLTDVFNAVRYLPNTIPVKVLDWLDDAVRGGVVPNADFRVNGSLQDFPFRNDEGQFLITVDFVEGVLAYGPGWPEVSNASGQLVFDGPALYSTQNKAEIAGIAVADVDARIADLRDGIVVIESVAQTRLTNVLNFLRRSPIRKAVGQTLDDLRANGPASGKIKLTLPILDIDNWQLSGYLDTRNATVGLKDFDYKFSDLTGRATITNTRIELSDVSARIFEAPVSISVAPVSNAAKEATHRAQVNGNFELAKLADAFSLPMRQYYSGNANATAETVLGQLDAESSAAFSLQISSDLVGAEINLPYPLNKAASDAEKLDLDVRFPQEGVIDLSGTLERGLNWYIQMQAIDAEWQFYRGAVGRGAVPVDLPDEPGLLVSGYLDSLRLDDWAALEVSAQPPITDAPNQSVVARRWQDLFRYADLQLGELFAAGFRFEDVDAKVDFGADAWDIDLSGPWAQGNINLPYEFSAQTRAVLNMGRLLLIETEADSTGNATGDGEAGTDPRDLPAIEATVADFALGNLRFGELTADVERVADGLKTRKLATSSDTFATETSADWLVVDNAQRSRLNTELRSWDIRNTLVQLGYSPVLTGKSGVVNANLLWEGGPGAGFLNSSTGQLDFEIRDGRVNDLDAGGGRLIGLLSLTSLPRRLALDFRDIISDDLEYASLSGRFRLDFGNAWTCNTSLISEVADIALVGRAGLVAEDYEQLAVVRPHVSSMLPLPAAVLGGPTAGVATLLISQLFKKPLSGIGETYYAVEGTFSEPQFNPVQRNQIDTSSFADCEDQLPNLSPEEIEALEELLKPTELESGAAEVGDIGGDPSNDPGNDPISDPIINPISDAAPTIERNSETIPNNNTPAEVVVE